MPEWIDRRNTDGKWELCKVLCYIKKMGTQVFNQYLRHIIHYIININENTVLAEANNAHSAAKLIN